MPNHTINCETLAMINKVSIVKFAV